MSPIYVEENVVRQARGLKFEDSVEGSEKLRKWLTASAPEDFGEYKM